MFLVQEDIAVMQKINFLTTGIIPKNIDSYIKDFYKLPINITLVVEMGEFSIFPDILTKPLPMVSEVVMNVMKMYRVKIAYRRLILTDCKSGEFKTYYLLYPDEKTVSLFRDFEINITENGKISCTISLDFAESILRRDVKGIQLLEI